MADSREVEIQKMMGLLLAGAVVVVMASAFGARFLGHAAGSETEILTVLKTAEKKGLDLEIAPGVHVLGENVNFQRIQITADENVAHVNCTLDFTGKIDRALTVSSLGYEDIRFVNRSGDWVPESTLAPRLVKALAVLHRRSRALNELRLIDLPDGGIELMPATASARDTDFSKSVSLENNPDAGLHWPILPSDFSFLRAAGRDHRVLAWYLRSEREDIAVTEDFREIGSTPEGPFDQKASRTLRILKAETGDFFLDGEPF